MFLNIFFVHHSSTAAAEHGSDFRNQANDCELFVSRMDAVASLKGVPAMLRKTMIALAKAAALTSGLTVEALARGDAEGMRGPRCGWLRVKLVAPKSQAAALFYGRLFEIARAFKPLLRGDITEQGCKLMAMLGVVVNSLGNLEVVVPAASALAKRHVNYGVKAADCTPVGAALLWTLEQNLGLR
jgi:hypothetical protein